MMPKHPLNRGSARDFSSAFAGIESTLGVVGGDLRIVGTRIPVWVLEQARRLGSSESDILGSYSGFREP